MARFETTTEELNKKKTEEGVVEKAASETPAIDSSDYDDYNDEDNGLIIDTFNEVKNANSDECPASPTDEIPLSKLAEQSSKNLRDEVAKFMQATAVIDSPSESENLTLNLAPKVIPLSRSEQAARTFASDQEHETEKPNQKLTLSDLLSKMQEKKVLSETSVPGNTAQHMLSTLAASSQKRKTLF